MGAWYDTKFLPEGVRATGSGVDSTAITGEAELTDANTVCPTRGVRSGRRQGHYVRNLADLPAHGRAVRVRLSVWRFRCMTTRCATKTFSETIPASVARSHGHRTGRFRDLVAYLGRAMGGRLAQALGWCMLFGVSRDTFLRGATGEVPTDIPEPRVVGIDDGAWRKAQRYGTLIRNLERRLVTDLLPDRDPATVAAWLHRHPQIESVALDRNGGYGRATSQALPDAV